jgi:hypothetical protein
MVSGESRNRDNVSAHAGRIRLRRSFGQFAPPHPIRELPKGPQGGRPDSGVRGIPAGGPWPIRVCEQQVILALGSRDIDITN